MADIEAPTYDRHAPRNHSVTAIDFTDSHGRRRTVQIDELNTADAALAEKFGYKPVS